MLFDGVDSPDVVEDGNSRNLTEFADLLDLSVKRVEVNSLFEVRRQGGPTDYRVRLGT